MICIVLRQTGEVHVSAGVPRRQYLVQTICSEGKYGYPYFSIQLMKLIDASFVGPTTYWATVGVDDSSFIVYYPSRLILHRLRNNVQFQFESVMR